MTKTPENSMKKIKTYENIKIYQGDQIGGCVTVISSTVNGETHRIMIDYGSSLEGSGSTRGAAPSQDSSAVQSSNGAAPNNSNTPKDFTYPWDDEPVDAVFFTHYHGDHVGRIGEIPKSVKTLYMGDTARKVMINIQKSLSRIRKENDANAAEIARAAKAELELLKEMRGSVLSRGQGSDTRP